MKLSLSQYLPALLAVMIITACATENQVRLTDKNFTNEIRLQQNLVFRFNRELVPDSLINIWDSTTYIKITPAVNGSFRWMSRKELVFSPSGEFRPATTYTASLTSNITKHSGENLSVEENEIAKFSTPALKAESSMSWWQLSQNNPGEVHLNIAISFNYHIDPAVIKNFLKIRINNNPVEFDIADNNTGTVLKVRTQPLSRGLVKGCTVEYTIAKGAMCQSCTDVTTVLQTGSEEVKGPGKLEILHVEGTLESGGGNILVYTNQEIHADNASQNISISPEVKFTVAPNGNGFIINGNFESGVSYRLDINKDLKGALGGALENNYNAFVPFGEMEPAISFTSAKGTYMSTRSSRNIALNISNIPKVHVRIFKVYENNIIAFHRYHRYNNYYDGESDGGYEYNEYDLDRMGDVILDQEYDVKNLAKNNGTHLLNLDFSQHSRFNGIYLVTASSTEDRWIKTSKIISISDIGIIARSNGDEAWVFANSIKDATPIKGASITFISTNNQVLGTAVTDNDGVAVLRSMKNKFPGFSVGMITANHKNDFNYLSVDDALIEKSRFDVGGKYMNLSGYEAYIYGDREIYRPGEQVYFNLITRNGKMKNVSQIPVNMRIAMPNGREYMNIRKTLSNQGSAEGSFTLGSSAVTGTWTMELYTSNNVLLSTRNFSVEEFIPDRITVKTSVDKNIYNPGDSVKAEFTAMNLFGTPAAQRNYELDFSLRKKPFKSKEFEGYNFDIAGAESIVFNNILKEGKTDVSGNGIVYFPVSESYSNTGLLNGRIFITVFDETGRPVNRVENFDISTQPVYYGIKLKDYYNSARQPLPISLAAAGQDGKSIATTNARFQIVKVDWETVLERNESSSYRYISQRKERILIDKNMNIPAGGNVFTFTPNESGQYYARIQDPVAATYVEAEFYAYGWGYTQNNAFQVNNEGQIEMELDRTAYEPGEKARILMKTPFAGKILVTVEREKVYEYFYVETDKRSAQVDIPISEEHLPNIYVTATLFRPLDDGQIPVTIAHGFTSIPVEKKSNRLPLEIQTVEKSRSKTTRKITVKTKPVSNIEVTVAVVDEGIMQLKNSVSPDPYGFFYQKRALQVMPFDIYPSVLPDIRLKTSSTGGDGYDLQKRINPMSNKRVKLVAYWSGILKTNANGMATCQVEIPQFSGDLRVMAVAYHNESFGSAEKHIKVADPLIISPSVPRFLTPGDQLSLPVTISNTTSSAKDVTLSVISTGPVEMTEKPVSISIPANGEIRHIFKASAERQTGSGTITIKAASGGEQFTDVTDITVRPATSLLKISGSGDIQGGESENVSMQHSFIPSSVDAKLVISRSPVVQFSDHLSYLLTYPYGCVEQTVSAVFPQLYYSHLAKAIANRKGTVQISTNVNAAIRKLQSMQQYNGSMSYWPGSNEESWWGSAYSLHFLNEAKIAGYEVSQTTLDKLSAYLSTQVKKHPVETYVYYDESGREVVKKIPAKDIFYSLYLLALYHKADISTMNYYRSRLDETAIDSDYLLAASYLATGDRKTYNVLLPKIFSGEKSKRATGGNFYSYIRDEAIALNALLETDPNNMQIPVMVKHLSTQMKNERYLSTQERVFAFLALGKFMKQAGESNVTATISSAGKKAGEFKGDDLTIEKGISDGNITIITSGQGKLYYFWEVEGLSGDGTFREEDSHLVVRRTFLNRFGKPLTDLKNIRQNDLIVVKLTLSNLAGNTVENIVISDLLPAGFEIDNPRITAVAELAWIKDNAVPDHMDIRDDRIHYFTSINDKPKSFYYLVRAVSTGTFVLGPVGADAMYDGSYHSYHGSGTITVKE